MNDYSKQRLVEFRSEDKAWVTGGKGTIPFEGFVETKLGELGHRSIIKGFQLTCQANLTVATAAMKGEDLYRIFRGITVEQKDNTKRYDDVPGDALRISNYGYLGPQRTKEHADVAIGTADITVTVYVPMSKAHLHEPDDTALAADVFKQLTVKMGQNSDLSQGTSVVTINSATYYVIAECYEEEDVVQHAVDNVNCQDMESPSASKLVVGGKLQDLYLYAPNGAGGGETLGGLTQVRVLELMRDALSPNPDICSAYARRRGIATNNRGTKGTCLYQDPFVCNSNASVDSLVQAIPIVACHGNKIAEDPVLGIAHVQLKYGGSTTSPFTSTPRLILRVLMPTNPKLTASIGKKFGASGTRPKVKKATNKGVRGDAQAYFPKQLTK